jgi:hypothetical protein
MIARAAMRVLLAGLLLACGNGGEAGVQTPADPRPDLQLLRVRMDLLAAQNSSLVAEVQNTGASAARGFGARCLWSCAGRSLYNTELRIMDDAALEAGESSSYSVAAPPHRFGCPAATTILSLSCTVDDRGRVEERDENNNAWSGPVRLAW